MSNFWLRFMKRWRNITTGSIAAVTRIRMGWYALFIPGRPGGTRRRAGTAFWDSKNTFRRMAERRASKWWKNWFDMITIQPFLPNMAGFMLSRWKSMGYARPIWRQWLKLHLSSVNQQNPLAG